MAWRGGDRARSSREERGGGRRQRQHWPDMRTRRDGEPDADPNWADVRKRNLTKLQRDRDQGKYHGGRRQQEWSCGFCFTRNWLYNSHCRRCQKEIQAGKDKIVDSDGTLRSMTLDANGQPVVSKEERRGRRDGAENGSPTRRARPQQERRATPPQVRRKGRRADDEYSDSDEDEEEFEERPPRDMNEVVKDIKETEKQIEAAKANSMPAEVVKLLESKLQKCTQEKESVQSPGVRVDKARKRLEQACRQAEAAEQYTKVIQERLEEAAEKEEEAKNWVKEALAQYNVVCAEVCTGSGSREDFAQAESAERERMQAFTQGVTQLMHLLQAASWQDAPQDMAKAMETVSKTLDELSSNPTSGAETEHMAEEEEDDEQRKARWRKVTREAIRKRTQEIDDMEQQLAQDEDEEQEEMRVEEEAKQRGETQNKQSTPQKQTQRRSPAATAASPCSVATVLESPPATQRSPTRVPGTPVQQLLKSRAENIIGRPSPSRSPLAQRQERRKAEERRKEEECRYNDATAQLTQDEKFYLESTLRCSVSTPPEKIKELLYHYRNWKKTQQEEEKAKLDEQLDRQKEEREAERARDAKEKEKEAKKDKTRSKEEERKTSRSPRRPKEGTATAAAADSDKED